MKTTTPLRASFALMIFFIALVNTAKSQTTQVAVIREWVQHFAKQDSIMESPCTSDKDGNFYVGGYTMNSVTGADIAVAKYDKNGNEIWTSVYSGSGRDQATAIALDTSGNVYVAGFTFVDSTNGFDYIILSYDSGGGIVWTSTYNGNYIMGYDIPVAIAVLDDGVYVTGTSQDSVGLLDIVTVKYACAGGGLDWVAQYDGSVHLYDVPRAMQTTVGNTVVITGGSQNSLLDWDYLTLEYDASGNLIDEVRVTNTGNSFDRANAVALTDLGTAYITWRAYVNSHDYDMRTIKIDSLGNLLWVVDYDYNGLMDEATSIAVDADENIYITGYGTADSANEDYVTIKYDSSGDLQWVKYFNGTTYNGSNGKDIAWDIDVDSFGVAYVTGETYNGSNSDFCTVAYQTTDGLLLWKDIYDGTGHCNDKATNVHCDTAGIVYGSVQACINDSTYEYVTIRYNSRHVLIPPDSVPCPSSFAFYGNFGQIIDTDDSVRTDIKFYTTNHYPALYFSEPDTTNDYTVLSYVFAHIDDDTATTDTLHRVDLTFESYAKTFEPMVQKPHAFPVDKSDQGYLNYYLAQCPNGITGVEGYERISYPDAFYKTDLMFFGNKNGMKFYIVVKPDGTPNIALKFTGQDTLVISDSTLEIVTSIGSYIYDRPKVFQIDSLGNRVAVSWTPEYSDLGNGRVGFPLGSYNSNQPLVIEVGKEPIPNAAVANDNLEWSMLYGGFGTDAGADVAVNESDGSFVVTGSTFSIDFPIDQGANPVQPQNAGPGNYDAFVIKFSLQNARFWATYYGGSNDDRALGVAVDTLGGYIYFVGKTLSNNLRPAMFPGLATISTGDTLQSAQDAFIVKLRSNGQNDLWANYIGGNFSDVALSVAVDANQNVYTVGYTSSNVLFPIVTSANAQAYNQIGFSGGGDDGFILKFNSSGTQLWGSYFGGDGLDRFHDISINGSHVNVVGMSSTNIGAGNNFSPCFPDSAGRFPDCNPGGGAYYQPSNAGLSDLIIVEFDDNNRLIWSTQFGGDKWEGSFPASIASSSLILRDSTDNAIYIAGDEMSQPWTTQSNFPMNNTNGMSYQQTYQAGINVPSALYSDAFIAKFENRSLAWSTFYGGGQNSGGEEASFGITTDDQYVYLTGVTRSSNGASPGNYCLPPDTSGFFPLCTNCTNCYFNDSYATNYLIGGDPMDNVFIAAFDLNNQLVWSTYFSEVLPSSPNWPVPYTLSLAASKEFRKLHLTGYTASYNATYWPESFPVRYPGGPAWNQQANANPSNQFEGWNAMVATCDLNLP